MPPAKQQRILIWRSEVASAISANSAPSLASSHTSTSLSSAPLDDPEEPSAASSPANLHPPSPSPSRPRSLWKRLSSRFSGRGSNNSKPKEEGPLVGLGVDRTAMYRNEGAAQARLDLDEEGGLAERSSDGARGLKEKQERLRRAAKLLNQEGF